MVSILSLFVLLYSKEKSMHFTGPRTKESNVGATERIMKEQSQSEFENNDESSFETMHDAATTFV